MKFRVILICGDQSPYGFAHIEPILKEFDVKAVVIPTRERWNVFRKKIENHSFDLRRIWYLIKIILKKILLIGKNKEIIDDLALTEKICTAHHIPLLHIFDVNNAEFIEKVKQHKPQIILSAAYPQIFHKTLLSIPELGTVNFHPSLLPKFRGGHPHFWSIAIGEKQGGITAHLMIERVDAGDIVVQIAFPIDQYYYGDLYKKMIDETPSLVKMVREFFEEERKPIKQDENAASYFKNDNETNWRILWKEMSSQSIYNLIRTEHAFCFFKNKKVRIKRANILEENYNIYKGVKSDPGTIIGINETSVIVATKDLPIGIHILSQEGLNFDPHAWVKHNKTLIGEKFK